VKTAHSVGICGAAGYRVAVQRFQYDANIRDRGTVGINDRAGHTHLGKQTLTAQQEDGAGHPLPSAMGQIRHRL
jgi:hypothetical protein